MSFETPASLIAGLVNARNNGEIDMVLACYELVPTIVPSPGNVQSGIPALRAWLASFAASRPKFTVKDRMIVEGQDIALHCCAWDMTGTDQSGQIFRMQGRSADVFRRQANGMWLVALDNPWGTASI